MVKTQLKQEQIRRIDARAGYRLVVMQFLFTWGLFMVLLTGTVLLMNIDWARPRVQEMMSESLHRQVELGRLSWTLSLNGLAISTTKMSVKSLQGEPFLNAGESEIGVAFIPLTQGKLIIRHLTFQTPELWAERIRPGLWNFTDLVEAGPDIRFIQVDRGKFHMADRPEGSRGVPAWSPYVFENVKMKLVWPRDKRRWPFYLAFDLPRPGYTTRVKVTTLGTGTIDQWQDNKYQFDLVAEKLNPQDLGPFARNLPPMKGLGTLTITGEGVVAKGLKGSARGSVDTLDLMSPDFGDVKIPAASGQAAFLISKDKFDWSEVTVRIGGLELKSKGALTQWQGNTPAIQGNVRGTVADLRRMPKITLSGRPSTQSQRLSPLTLAESLIQLIRQDKIGGAAAVDLRFSGPSEKPAVQTEIEAQGLPARELIESGPLKGVALLRLAGIDSSARLSGHVDIDENGRMVLKEAELTGHGTVLKATGFWDQATGQSKLQVVSKGLNLDALDQRLKTEPESSRKITRALKLPSARAISFSGKMDVDGHVEQTGGLQKLNVGLDLDGVSVRLADGSSSATNITGRITQNGRTIKIDNLKGALGDGQFSLNGTMGTAPGQQLDLTLKAAHIELHYLDRALEVMKLDFPLLAEHQLFGRVKDFTLRVKGTARDPEIALWATPEDLYYRPPGLTRPLRAVSGNINYENDELTLKDVGLVSQGNKLTTNLAIQDLSGKARLKRLKVKTTGIDLADVNFYLSSSLMPPPLRKGYIDFLNRYQLANIRGRAYGDVLWLSRPDGDFDFDGVVGFFNAGLKFGTHGYPVERVSGILAAAGRELLIQDLTGNIGHSHFELDGHVTNYRTGDASWQTELKANLLPSELTRLVPGLADQLNFKLVSSGPVALRATVTGNPKASQVIFSGKADAQDHLNLVTQFGSLYQPSGQAILIDGSMTLKMGATGNIQLNDSHIAVGDSVIQTRGTYTWYASGSKQDPQLLLQVSTPNPVAARTLVAIVDPTTKSDQVTGTVEGKVSAHGPISNLSAQGYIAFNKVSHPQFELFNVSGKAETEEFFLPTPGSDPSASGNQTSRAKLSLISATVGRLVISDVSADIFLESGDKNGTAPKVGLRDGSAKVAGGTVSMNGWLDMLNHRIHVDANLRQVSAEQVVDQLLNAPGEISGAADAHFILDSHGTEYQEMLRNLSGTGRLTVLGGKVARFGKLQEKLTQANLIQQGIFGFNLNNLLQSVAPVRTGEFKDLFGKFDIAGGVLSIDELRFSGEDMRLRAAGKVNLPLNTITLDVAGNLPRVASSILGGAVGEMSREITIQKMLNLITFRKLENLPSVPILGDIASDKPRAFTFQVAATLDKPSFVAKSIEKSFHWLPNHANASAHPVPGIN